MAGLSGVISAISADLTSKIALAGLPALVDGAIVVGRVASNLTSFCPRVVFVPLSFRFEAMSPGTNEGPIYSGTPGISGQGVRAVTMTAQGIGYVPATAVVTLSAPNVAGGTQATAQPVIVLNTATTGAIAAVKITNPGTGYTSPPTVTFSDTGGGTGATAVASLRQSSGALSVMTQRPIYTEWTRYSVECWGAHSVGGVVTPDETTGSVLDYDATQQLVHQVIASSYNVAPGVVLYDAGEWLDAKSKANLIDVVGHYATFEIEVAGPVLAEAMVPTPANGGPSIQFVPSATQPNPTLYLQPFDGGTPERGVPT